MAPKRNNLFLYLTLACFLGIILIFVFDGYMGVYDSLTIKSGEQPQTIETDDWLRQDSYWSIGIERGSKAFYHYQVDNRQFSTYMDDIEVSVWHSQEKVRDILSQQLVIGAFGNGQLEWVVDTAELLPADIPREQSYQFTLTVKRGEIERKIIMHINPEPYPPKPVRVP